MIVPLKLPKALQKYKYKTSTQRIWMEVHKRILWYTRILKESIKIEIPSLGFNNGSKADY